MNLFVIGIIAGFIIGVLMIEWLMPRFPKAFNRVFTWLDERSRAIDLTYYSVFDAATRSMRNRGWFGSRYAKFMLTVPILKQAGINKGYFLEIGSGPGYLGLEWLNSVEESDLVGIDISQEMVELATKNAKEYQWTPDYYKVDAHHTFFNRHMFDGAFSSASMHEWEDPVQVFREMQRILKPGAPFVIADLRRDASFGAKLIVKMAAWPGQVRPYLTASFNEAHTVEEVREMLKQAGISAQVEKSWYTLIIRGRTPK